MERKNFTEEEINKLKENKFVKSITTKSISYTDEFKKLFIEESKNFLDYIKRKIKIMSFLLIIVEKVQQADLKKQKKNQCLKMKKLNF